MHVRTGFGLWVPCLSVKRSSVGQSKPMQRGTRVPCSASGRKARANASNTRQQRRGGHQQPSHTLSLRSVEAGGQSHPGWLVGRSRISFSVMRRGRATANAITSATSAAVMASCA